jgi:hypothetical protein
VRIGKLIEHQNHAATLVSRFGQDFIQVAGFKGPGFQRRTLMDSPGG